jgi:hypothetical protein
MKRLAFLVLFACNTTSTATPPPPAPTPTPSSPPAAPTICTKDAECSLMSSYCSDLPCACVPYLTSGGAPKCNQPNAVKCFVDPCQRKAAGCQDGKCVVTSGATQ